MFLIGGISSKVKPRGVAENCACPVCGHVGQLTVIHKYMTPHIFFIPTFKFHSEYVVTCGGCASVMALAPEKGRLFTRDPGTYLYPEDMQVIQNNARQSCSSCGAQILPGQNFCPNCGAQV